MLRAWSDVYTVSFLRVSESSVRHLRKIKCKRSSLVFLCWASVCWEPSKSRNATRMQFLIHSWIGLMQQVLGRQQRRMLNKPIYLQHINGRRGRVCGWYHPKAKCIYMCISNNRGPNTDPWDEAPSVLTNRVRSRRKDSNHAPVRLAGTTWQ